MAETSTKAKESREVVETKIQLPTGYNLDELRKDAETNPKMSSGDIALPYIVVLQTNSPQVNPAKAEYLPEAKPGLFYNTVLNIVYGKNLVVVPCGYERKIMEWVHRDVGGGLVGEHPLESSIMSHARPDEKGKPRLPNGNVLVETAYHYIIVRDSPDNAWFQAIFPMSSTFLKKNRKWNNLISTSKIPGTDLEAPRYLFAYDMTTEIESKGENSWFVPDMKRFDEPVDLEIYNFAKRYAKLVQGGQVTRSAEPMRGEDRIDPETGEVL